MSSFSQEILARLNLNICHDASPIETINMYALLYYVKGGHSYHFLLCFLSKAPVSIRLLLYLSTNTASCFVICISRVHHTTYIFNATIQLRLPSLHTGTFLYDRNLRVILCILWLVVFLHILLEIMSNFVRNITFNATNRFITNLWPVNGFQDSKSYIYNLCRTSAAHTSVRLNYLLYT